MNIITFVALENNNILSHSSIRATWDIIRNHGLNLMKIFNHNVYFLQKCLLGHKFATFGDLQWVECERERIGKKSEGMFCRKSREGEARRGMNKSQISVELSIL